MKKENNNDIIEKLDKIISNQEKNLKLLEKRKMMKKMKYLFMKQFKIIHYL